MKAIDFFCGAGGLTRGFLDADIAVLAGVDVDARLRDTYEKNNSGSRFICRDIGSVAIRDLRSELGIGKDDLVLYAACTPCQPFSSLNQQRSGSLKSSEPDPRRSLLLTFGELVKSSPPDFVVVENVPGLGSANGRAIYDQFLRQLMEAGLRYVDRGQLDAQEYGVPQVRKRFLLIASAHGPISLPRPSPGPPPTVRSAIGHLGAAKVGIQAPGSRGARSSGAELAIPNHVARSLSAHHLRIVEAVPKDGGSRRDVVDTSILLDCHRKSPNLHRDVFGRLSWNGPAPTMTCRCTDVYCGRFTHPSDDRGLTLREAAAIQTFRDDYAFYGTFFHAAQQIGNAVPVRLAERMGRAVMRAAKQIESCKEVVA